MNSSRNLNDTGTVVTTATNSSFLHFQPHARMESDGRLMGPMYHRSNNRIKIPNRMSESTYSLDYTTHASKQDIKNSFRTDATTTATPTDHNDGFFAVLLSFLQSIINRKAVHAECLPAEILDYSEYISYCCYKGITCVIILFEFLK